MTVTNARPSGFTQLSTTADWETFCALIGSPDCVLDVPGGGALKPTLDSGTRSAVVAAGSAIVKGEIWSTTANVLTAIPAASSSNRIDRLVLQLNRAAGSAATVIQPVIVEGTPSGSPVAPSITRNATGLWQIPISQWVSNSDGTLTGLQDQRDFAGSPIQNCSSSNRPFMLRPGLAYETNTDAFIRWDGNTWKYITTPFDSNAKITTNDVGPISGEQTIHSITIVTDGNTDIDVLLNWSAIYKQNDTNPPNSQRLVFKILIDGNLVNHTYHHIANDVSNGTFVSGGSILYRTSSAAGDRPSGGSHTILFNVLQDIGGANLFIKAEPTSPITMRVSADV